MMDFHILILKFLVKSITIKYCIYKGYLKKVLMYYITKGGS